MRSDEIRKLDAEKSRTIRDAALIVIVLLDFLSLPTLFWTGGHTAPARAALLAGVLVAGV